MSNAMSRRQFLTLMGGSAAVLGLGLVGCGGSSDSADATTSSKKYTVATDTVFAPFEFTDDNGDFVGIDVDILSACLAVAGLDYELNSLGFDAAVAALESGQADGVIAGMSITDERKEKYDFSDAYYDSAVCCAAKDGGDISKLEDLKGKTVAAKTGTQSASWAESIKDEYGFTVAYVDTSDLMYQGVTSSQYAACFEDEPVMAYGVKQGNGLTMIGREADEFASPYGFAVLKGKNSELLEGFNKGLSEIKDNGKYDEIVSKYTEA